MKKIKKSAGKNGNAKTKASERSSFFAYLGLAAALLGGVSSFACQPNRQIMNSSQSLSPTPMASASTKKNSVEQEVRNLQTADFDYIFVVRRKDGGAFDADDRKYLRENTPRETNRFIAAEDGTAFVIGTSFEFFPEQTEALKQRFNIEDLSKPKPKEETNSQSNGTNRTENGNQKVDSQKPQSNR